MVPLFRGCLVPFQGFTFFQLGETPRDVQSLKNISFQLVPGKYTNLLLADNETERIYTQRIPILHCFKLSATILSLAVDGRRLTG